MFPVRRPRVAQVTVVAGLAVLLGACAIAPPRRDDPWQGFNRKMFTFNQSLDKAVVRPVAKGYVKVTGPNERIHISDFFSNLRTPITIANEALQGRPQAALQSTARFVINSTIGLLGFYDPATHLDLPTHTTDFGVTLARWGVPEGPYLVLPFFGPNTVRDVWRLPADYLLNPAGWYLSQQTAKWYALYPQQGLYLVTLRAQLLPFDQTIDSAFDPYVFVRSGYLQHRLNMIYFGNPPLSAIEQLQGTRPSEKKDKEIQQLLQQQEEYEKTHGAGAPAPAASAPAPAASAMIPVPTASTHSVPPIPAARSDSHFGIQRGGNNGTNDAPSRADVQPASFCAEVQRARPRSGNFPITLGSATSGAPCASVHPATEPCCTRSL